MGTYFTERWDALIGLPAAIAENPVLYIIFFAIALPLIWVKWRLIGKSQQKAIANQTHGLRSEAVRKNIRHETGIGTAEILVMRRAKLGAAIWFALFFFGGGAVFYFLVVLPESDELSKDLAVFAIMLGFSIIGIGVIMAHQTRIYVDDKGLEKRRLLRSREKLSFADITDIQPARKKLTYGLVLHAKGGKRMKITADFSGYLNLLDRLAPSNPKLGVLARIIRTQATKAT